MKILVVHNFYRSSAPSGEDAVYRMETQMLEAAGVQVIRYEKHNDELNDSGLRPRLVLAKNTIWSHESAREITALVRMHRPDVVHFHNTFPQISPSAYKACRELGVPVVQTLHNYRLICPGALLQRESGPCEECIQGNLLSSLQHRCYRGSMTTTAVVAAMIAFNRHLGSYYHNVDCYIAPNTFSVSRFTAAGLPAAKMIVKPNFVSDIPPATPWLNRQNQVLFAGRLTEEKGIRTLIRAWQHIDDISLLIAGDGELRVELERQAAERNLRVTFLGTLSKELLFKQMQQSKLIVIPSLCYEMGPLTALEALANGLPVVASRMGGLDQLIEDGHTGFKFEPGDSDSLVKAIRAALADEMLLKDISESGRSLAVSRFSDDANLTQLLSIYESLTSSSCKLIVRS